MTTSPRDDPPSRLGWLRPPLVVLLGTVVVTLLLLLPIRIGPGDHEDYASCGNALHMDLGRWARHGNLSEGRLYWEQAYRSCTARRVDRIGWAVGVLSATFLVSTLMARRETRRVIADEVG
ncbi:hypothetical protein AB0H57_20695 [Micromonospora sp. NPDC050686]|uniref:hypothetical protein n=1 Tax=Micromonospora sp. NPDC050686 TaxID=3154631 RepID=UPI00340160AA